MANLRPGETATVVGTVRTVGERKLRGRRAIVSALLEDESGAVPLVWFNQPWVARQIPRGSMLRAIGPVTRFQGRLQLSPTEFDPVGEDERPGAGLLPIYPLTDEPVSDPLSQAMALTAIVIGMAVTALLLVLVLRVTQALHSRDLDELAEEEAERDLRLERRHAPGQESEEAAAR